MNHESQESKPRIKDAEGLIKKIKEAWTPEVETKPESSQPISTTQSPNSIEEIARGISYTRWDRNIRQDDFIEMIAAALRKERERTEALINSHDSAMRIATDQLNESSELIVKLGARADAAEKKLKEFNVVDALSRMTCDKIKIQELEARIKELEAALKIVMKDYEQCCYNQEPFDIGKAALGKDGQV